MILIIGVKFRKSSKVYYFDPAGLSIKKGNHVIVETARGVEYGTVVLGPRNIDNEKIVQPLKSVIRVATEEDDNINEENTLKEKEAFDICLEKIKKHELGMKLIDSEYTFDKNKLLFYFTADGRIDFRDLVKDLAAIFRTRIELRQIGVRDETKLMGGIGICGRPLCCHIYLADFAPVSIKMAKEQNLSLNPAKISGVCGRLMCCLKNEEDAYEYLNSTLPNINSKVKTKDGFEGIVQSVSVLKQRVKVLITRDNDDKELREYHTHELIFEKKKTSSEINTVAMPLPDEEIDENALKELEQMEQNDIEELCDIDDGQTQKQQLYKKQLQKQQSHKQQTQKQQSQKQQSQKKYPKKANNKQKNTKDSSNNNNNKQSKNNVQNTNDNKKHNRYNNGHNHNKQNSYRHN